MSKRPEWLEVLIYERPWNRECELPKGNYRRCKDCGRP